MIWFLFWLSQCDILADLNIKLTALRNCPLLKGLDDLTLKRLSVHFRLHKFRARQSMSDKINDVFSFCAHESKLILFLQYVFYDIDEQPFTMKAT